MLREGVAIGPGKADLLAGIRETGSIAAAGRRMDMSYKRAWYLIAELNACFREPVVEAAKGGKTGGGAHLTPLGEEILVRYRRMESQTTKAIAAELRSLRRKLAPTPASTRRG